MLQYCTFSFELKLLSDCHVGDGTTRSLEDLCSDGPRKTIFKRQINSWEDGKAPEVAVITRGEGDKPVIEVTGLRGALRTLMRENGLDTEIFQLLGSEFSDETETTPEDSGRLWLYGGLVTNTPTDCGQLPYWDNNKGSFILTGHAGSRDLGTVESGKLFNKEYLPAGTVVEYEGVYQGSPTECESELQSLFKLMNDQNGFKLGAGKGYEYGLVRLNNEEISGKYHHYCVRTKKFDAAIDFSIVCSTGQGENIFIKLDVACPGPFFIQDPSRDLTTENLDWQALHRTENQPVLTGKAFLQNTRRIAAWQEAVEALEPAFDYENLMVDDPNKHLKNSEGPASLSKTQRLFGVPGWGKTLSVHRVDLHPFGRNYYRAQSIQLDTFTQGTIDGAMVEFNIPCGVGATIWLKLAKYRYADDDLYQEDKEFLNGVINQIKGDDTIMLGHSIAAGFGWCRVEESEA